MRKYFSRRFYKAKSKIFEWVNLPFLRSIKRILILNITETSMEIDKNRESVFKWNDKNSKFAPTFWIELKHNQEIISFITSLKKLYQTLKQWFLDKMLSFFLMISKRWHHKKIDSICQICQILVVFLLGSFLYLRISKHFGKNLESKKTFLATFSKFLISSILYSYNMLLFQICQQSVEFEQNHSNLWISLNPQKGKNEAWWIYKFESSFHVQSKIIR